VDYSHIKSLIQSRQRQIHETSASAVEGTATVELDQSTVGRLSRIDAMQMQQMNLESERRRQRELVALDAALSRIKNDEYGLCLQCDEEINPKRLEIDLTARYCINCANKREQT
jgi:DnaK suppressor protein